MTDVVRLEPGDAKPMAALHARCFTRGWTTRDIESLLRQAGVAGFRTAESGGMVLVRRVVDEAEILTIGVDPAKRRAGLGAVLLSAAIEEVSAQGAQTMFLDVSTENPAALALYFSQGFVECGRRPGYYPDGADAILMKRDCTA